MRTWYAVPLLLLAVSLALAQERSREQEQAVAAIKRLGGKVEVDEDAPGRPVVAVDLSRTKATGAALAPLKAFPQLRTLDLRSTKVKDADLGHLRDCKELRMLDVFNTMVTDAGARELQRALPKLKILR